MTNLQFLLSEVTAEHVIIPMLARQGGKAPGADRGSNRIVISEQNRVSSSLLEQLLSLLKPSRGGAFGCLVLPVTYLHPCSA